MTNPGDHGNQDLEGLARAALGNGDEEVALPILLSAARTSGSGRLWQWAGLLARSIDDLEQALSCFAQAAQLEPDDASIAKGYAQVTLEAGEDAVSRFETARRLAPQDGSVHLGLASARLARGHAEEAIAELDAVVSRSPGWIEGQLQLAQIRAFAGVSGGAGHSLEQAIQRQPEMAELWLALCTLRLRQEDYPGLRDSSDRGLSLSRMQREFSIFRAIASGELQEAAADHLLSEAAVQREPQLALWRIRHLLRQGMLAEALPAIDRELESERANSAWPYAALAWRLADDERWRWLEDDRLIRPMDLRGSLGDLDEIATDLRRLHDRSGQFIDQSVRGGSQTDGPLLSRIAPPIRRLRRAIVAAIEDYVSGLPPPDPQHPLLGPRRDRRTRFMGSWSVRLRGGGHHSSHVHPQGWISSALYIALPPPAKQDPKEAGWLTFGEPPNDLKTGLTAYRTVEPDIGRLILFPSYVWHGTRPFTEGERLTVAFDVAPPR